MASGIQQLINFLSKVSEEFRSRTAYGIKKNWFKCQGSYKTFLTSKCVSTEAEFIYDIQTTEIGVEPNRSWSRKLSIFCDPGFIAGDMIRVIEVGVIWQPRESDFQALISEVFFPVEETFPREDFCGL